MGPQNGSNHVDEAYSKRAPVKAGHSGEQPQWSGQAAPCLNRRFVWVLIGAAVALGWGHWLRGLVWSRALLTVSISLEGAAWALDWASWITRRFRRRPRVTLSYRGRLRWEEVAAHNTAGSAWVAAHGKVYDVTDFVDRHPGGRELILLAAGRDATYLIESYHPFTEAPWRVLVKHEIGELASNEHPPYAAPATARHPVEEPVAGAAAHVAGVCAASAGVLWRFRTARGRRPIHIPGVFTGGDTHGGGHVVVRGVASAAAGGLDARRLPRLHRHQRVVVVYCRTPLLGLVCGRQYAVVAVSARGWTPRAHQCGRVGSGFAGHGRRRRAAGRAEPVVGTALSLSTLLRAAAVRRAGHEKSPAGRAGDFPVADQRAGAGEPHQLAGFAAASGQQTGSGSYATRRRHCRRVGGGASQVQSGLCASLAAADLSERCAQLSDRTPSISERIAVRVSAHHAGHYASVWSAPPQVSRAAKFRRRPASAPETSASIGGARRAGRVATRVASSERVLERSVGGSGSAGVHIRIYCRPWEGKRFAGHLILYTHTHIRAA
eukprot:ctg_562.g260